MNRPDKGIHSHNHQTSQQLKHQLGLDLYQPIFVNKSMAARSAVPRCMHCTHYDYSLVLVLAPVPYIVLCTVQHCTVPRYSCTCRRTIGNPDVISTVHTVPECVPYGIRTSHLISASVPVPVRRSCRHHRVGRNLKECS